VSCKNDEQLVEDILNMSSRYSLVADLNNLNSLVLANGSDITASVRHSLIEDVAFRLPYRHSSQLCQETGLCQSTSLIQCYLGRCIWDSLCCSRWQMSTFFVKKLAQWFYEILFCSPISSPVFTILFRLDPQFFVLRFLILHFQHSPF